ncbi:MAG: hypothetical protein ACI8PD_002182, partial [Nitrospinales bacterium]
PKPQTPNPKPQILYIFKLIIFHKERACTW